MTANKQTIKEEVKTEKEDMKRDNFFQKMEFMFEHKSKLSKLVDSQVIKNYRDTYFYLFEQIEKKKTSSSF